MSQHAFIVGHSSLDATDVETALGMSVSNTPESLRSCPRTAFVAYARNASTDRMRGASMSGRSINFRILGHFRANKRQRKIMKHPIQAHMIHTVSKEH